jgi:6,7-dimethyl-8-ribityllumazine synthase
MKISLFYFKQHDMASKLKNLSEHSIVNTKGANKWRIGIVVSEYNDEITFALRNECIDTLKKYGVSDKNIFMHLTPGAYELPLAAKWLYKQKKADAVICLGCVIKGDTDHDIYINNAVSKAILDLGIQTGCPFVFGVITPNNMQQAKDRAGGKHGNKGVECAVAALKMLTLKQELKYNK